MVRLYGGLIAALLAAAGGACPTAAWAESVETALMPGEVIEGHAKWEEDCAKCHMRFNKAAQTSLCLDCHKDVATDVAQKTGYHGRLKEGRACRECHSEHKGRKENIAPITEQTFTHGDTDFPLGGAHADSKKVECRACHKAKAKYRSAPSDCYACHEKDDKHKGNLGLGCADCHTERNWKETKFDHSKTKFTLRGKHADVKCQDCHDHERYKNTPMDCHACHEKDDYHKGVFGPQCGTCHGERDWKTSSFNHDKDTKYPLKGKHAKTKCESCHKVPVAKGKTPTKCLACHQKDDKHKGRYGEKCESCHVEKDWKAMAFDHDRDTTYLLKGKHRTTKCNSCHKGHLYKEKTPASCLACHKKDDKHKGSYGEKCESCHMEKDWKTITFDHDRDTRYPLKGKHKTTKCESCHKGHLYKEKTPTTCLACHKKDDKHKGSYGEKCESCHVEKDWKTITFDHDRDDHVRP
ncbi:MAG: cytochrome C [Nitrospirae bacterium]|nr:cytochrome C [Nitrospirota bacterium]